MPQIPQYTAPDESLTPSSRGVNAWESAARRISAFAGAEAGDARAEGALKAASYKQLLWPFDILELYERKASQAAQAVASTSTKSDRVSFRVTGSINPETAERRAAGTYRLGGETNESIANRGGASYQISRGAGALGSALADGGQAMSSRNQAGRPIGKGDEEEALTYEGGQLMTVSEAARARTEYNTAQDKQITSYTDDLRDYWRRAGGTSRPVDPTTGDPGTAGYPMSGSYNSQGTYVPDARDAPAVPDPVTWYNPSTWFGAPTYSNATEGGTDYGSKP